MLSELGHVVTSTRITRTKLNEHLNNLKCDRCVISRAQRLELLIPKSVVGCLKNYYDFDWSLTFLSLILTSFRVSFFFRTIRYETLFLQRLTFVRSTRFNTYFFYCQIDPPQNGPSLVIVGVEDSETSKVSWTVSQKNY